MPIGKNALKRVTGAKAEEPKEEKAPKVEVKAEPKKASPKKTTPPKKAEPKKAAPKKAEPKKTAPKKSMETEPTFSPVKTAEKITQNKAEPTRSGNGYINIGGELPIYLL